MIEIKNTQHNDTTILEQCLRSCLDNHHKDAPVLKTKTYNDALIEHIVDTINEEITKKLTEQEDL